MMNQSSSPTKRHGLRKAYLIISTVVVGVIITATIFSSLHIKEVTTQNTQSLKLQETVSSSTTSIRRDISAANSLLDELLVNPSDEKVVKIKKLITRAVIESKQLSQTKNLNDRALLKIINELEKLVILMRKDVMTLLELRNDPEWVYPVITIMNQDMLSSNIQFTSSIELILHDLQTDEENNIYKEKLLLSYKLYSIRDTWRIMVLNFRTVLLRFAGLNKVDQIEQERNIIVIKNVISENISELIADAEKDSYNINIQDSLLSMEKSLSDWTNHFKRFQALREASVWRNDLNFSSIHIRPKYNKIIGVLEKLDKGISLWANRNSLAVKNAAYNVNLELFALSALAISFVIAIYILINKFVLIPIAQISDSLGKESHGDNFVLPRQCSQEVYNLIASYNRMRELVQLRQNALEHQALHDSLTGLPNRALLHDRLECAIDFANRNKSNIAFMMIDLDRFKEINDTLGHQVGDRVLTQLGERLYKCIRKTDTVARLGGDEFALIIPDVSEKQATSFAIKITNTINEVLMIENQNLFISASIGIAMFPIDGEDADVLVRYADIAMYHAKQNNQHFALFNPSMDKVSIDNLALLGDFKQELNLNSGQLQLYYQPKIDLRSQTIVSVEALLRWQHPQQDFIPPEFVIKMAEQSGLIGELTEWVISQAIKDCSDWRKNNPDIGVSVNLSAWNLQDPALPSLVKNTLNTHKLHPSFLSLEITESAVMTDPARAKETLNDLDDMGIQLEIDDYGTGFSSLAYLKLLPVSTLKIDKSFVMDMLNDPNDLIIVRSTIDLAHNLGMVVIAEGVENKEILACLQQLQCDLAQGYFIAKPIPKDELLQWMQSYNFKEMTT